MGYILELRKQVGHRPLIMTCAGVLLLNEKRELLLQKRADNGLWGDRKSTRLNSSHNRESRMPSSA